MSLLQPPEPKALDILEIGDGKDHRAMTYSVDKPHPGYGKDPNILNEYGHSVYPKMVYPNGNSQPGHLVNSKQEEDTAMGVELKDGGPTIKQFTDAGYKAKDYPPQGFKPVSSQEEIDAAVKAQSSDPW